MASHELVQHCLAIERPCTSAHKPSQVAKIRPQHRLCRANHLKWIAYQTHLEQISDPISSIFLSKVDTPRAICILQLNKGQQILLTILGSRVKEEIIDEINGMHGRSEPLRWMLSGGPSTRNSIVPGMVVHFFELLGYVKDKHSDIQAFLGKTLPFIGGSTLHQLGVMNLFGNNASKEK